MHVLLDPSKTNAFPYGHPARERLEFLLRYAILAPSYRNAQPWRFHVTDRWIDVSVDPDAIAPIADAEGRERTMDVGVVTDHLVLAMHWHLMEDRVEYLPDPKEPETLVRVHYVGDASYGGDDAALFCQIERRHTVVDFDSDAPLPFSALAELEGAAKSHGAEIVWVRHGLVRHEVSEMIRRADEILFDSERYRKELADWTREDWEAAGDGVSAEALGVGGFVRRLFPWLVGHVDLGKAVGNEERIRAITAPALGMLCTKGDGVTDWLDAGRALSRTLLRACASGLRGSSLNAPLEVPGIRTQIRHEMHLAGHPQAILRLGPGPVGRPKPRRPLESFIDRRASGRG